MKFTKQDLLTLLIGLFLFASCKDSSTIGLDLDPDQSISGTLVDTITIKSQTIKDDVTSGASLLRHPLGYMVDADFGKTEAGLAMAVGLPSAGGILGTSALIDSAVLILPYSTQFYGDTTASVYSIKVNQLTNDLSKEASYAISKTWPTEMPILGTFSGRIKPNTKFQVTDIVAGVADTLKTVIPQIRIKLDNEFIRSAIVNQDSTTLSKLPNFFRAFKGLYVSATATEKGGVMFFDFTGTEEDTEAKIEIFYKKPNATTPTLTDTLKVSFPITTTSGPVTAAIKHDYTGTPVQAQLDTPDPVTPYASTYLQALAGLKNKISFPYLSQFVADVKAGNANTKIAVNKAELVIDLTDGTDLVPFSAAQRLAFYRYDIAGQRANVPDNDNSIDGQYNGDPRALGGDPTLFGGYFDSVRKRYIFSITSYIQDLLDGKTEDYGTFLAPSSISEFDVSPPLTSAARAIISTHKKNPAAGDKQLKLNIYYTKVN